MALTEQQRVILDWRVARDGAEALLKSLQDARAESEKRMRELKQSDPIKKVTGRSAMDNAIASTQRMIETLNRAIAQLEHNLEEDMRSMECAGRGS